MVEQMARDGITYEQVAEAALALLNDGEKPTIRAVRARLRDTGSPNTIHKHLRSWLARPEQVAGPERELPASLGRVFVEEVARAVAEACGPLEERLAAAEQNNVELSTSGEALEDEVEALRTQHRVLGSELDTERGRVAQQASELERVTRELDRERHAAENGRAKLAESAAAIEALRGAAAERDSQLQALRDEVKTTRAALGGVERELAGAQATVSALTARSQELQQTATFELNALRERLDQSATRERDLTAELARRDVAAHGAQKSSDDWRAMVEAGAARERELAAQLARAEAAVETCRMQQQGALERARLEWQLERAAEGRSEAPEPQKKQRGRGSSEGKS